MFIVNDEGGEEGAEVGWGGGKEEDMTSLHSE